MAARIGRGNVSFVGWVRVGPADGAWTPGSVADVLSDPTSLQGRMLVVLGWLTGFGGPIPCPRPVPPSGADLDTPFTCGDAAWITLQRYVATTIDSEGVSIKAPPDGLRVQNGAYEQFAEGATVSPAGVAEPRQGLYL